MTIYTNEMDYSKKWWFEIYWHPWSWSLPLAIVVRPDDIYAVTVLCVTFQWTRNEDWTA
jgi:hypothetical protein